MADYCVTCGKHTAMGNDYCAEHRVTAPDPADKDRGADQFQNVNRRAGYGDKYEQVYRFAKKGATLAAGEGALLVAEIERLQSENADLRRHVAALDRECNELIRAPQNNSSVA